MSGLIREQIIKKLIELQQSDDTEAAHCDADELLCNLLSDLGYDDVVAEYRKVDKWYA